MNEMGKVLVNLEVEDLGLYQVSLFFCLVRLLTVSHVCWLWLTHALTTSLWLRLPTWTSLWLLSATPTPPSGTSTLPYPATTRYYSSLYSSLNMHSWKIVTPAWKSRTFLLILQHIFSINNNNDVFFSVPFLLWSTRPIAWNKISLKKKKLTLYDRPLVHSQPPHPRHTHTHNTQSVGPLKKVLSDDLKDERVLDDLIS